MFFDTHAHYDDQKFSPDRDERLSSLRADGIAGVIIPGCDVESSSFSRDIAEKYDNVFFAAGVHPEDIASLKEGWLEEIGRLAIHEKCAAIGEIGLDYYWDDSQKELQKSVFSAQLHLALELEKPVIIHDRDAHGDCLDIIRKEIPPVSETELGSGRKSPGVFHCYSGSAEMAQELIRRGWYLGFDGPITYKNARKAIEVIEVTPLDRILIETDSPYLSPAPKRGERNDSRNLIFIAEKIAELKGESVDRIAEITLSNAERLFKLSV